MSRSLLSRRLDQLQQAGLVSRSVRDGAQHPEYHLTKAGQELEPIIFQLGEWGKRWVHRKISRNHLDAGVLMWDVQRRIDRGCLPSRKVVVYFHFTDASKKHQDFWLILDVGSVDLCLKDPGFDEHLYVRSTVRTFTEIWLGDRTLREAVSDGTVWLGGPGKLKSDFASWLQLSHFAKIAPRET